MGTMESQITSLTIVYSTVYSGADQRKHQNSASLAFVWGIHRWPVNSPHKWPVTRKNFQFDDVIMNMSQSQGLCSSSEWCLMSGMLIYHRGHSERPIFLPEDGSNRFVSQLFRLISAGFVLSRNKPHTKVEKCYFPRTMCMVRICCIYSGLIAHCRCYPVETGYMKSGNW